MIDKDTGSLTFGSGKIVSPKTSLSELIALKLSEEHEERKLGNGWIHYIVRNVEESGRFLNLTFIYHEESLYSVSFVVDGSPFKSSGGWGYWDEQRERRNAVIYEEWLSGEIGADRNFTWGSAWVTYDPKGGGSSIGIKYSITAL
ncbi:hypothetical protein [Rufibacter tibetensis]|uniref:Uncharacterized protein n=1 Tax=Rufibacter tibetensis TaxID=512763 RepID=A0A0N7HX06_9BACT|nr:hypothetical protein [Rufibacter tibetensis]ALJ00713.1 hypothetical protein DC20_19180 [Rufibacter tibetensis]